MSLKFGRKSGFKLTLFPFINIGGLDEKVTNSAECFREL